MKINWEIRSDGIYTEAGEKIIGWDAPHGPSYMRVQNMLVASPAMLRVLKMIRLVDNRREKDCHPYHCDCEICEVIRKAEGKI